MSTPLSIMIGLSLAGVMGGWAGVIFAGFRVGWIGAVVIGVLSVATIVLAIRAGRPLAMVPAVMHLGVCVGLTLVIWLAGLNAEQGQAAITYAGLGYLAFAVPASIFAYAKASAVQQA